MNNWNSFFAKSYCPSQLAWILLFSLSLGTNLLLGQSQLLTHPSFDNFSIKTLQEDFREAQASYPDKDLAGFYSDIKINLLQGLQKKATHEFEIGSDSLISYFYFEADIAPEDQVLLDDGLVKMEVEKLNFVGPIQKRSKLTFLDREPFLNSKLQIKGSIYRPKKGQDFGDAGSCQINPYCHDSNAALIDAAVHILWINGSIAGFCSGTLVNNTAQDFKPYILSAEHCALNPSLASNLDFSRWVFTFNYFSRNCTNPSTPQGINQDRLVGANLRARSNDNGGDTGSDLLFLELQNPIPSHFEAYYAGWNRWSRPALQGGCYHFPSGDIMKVSTFRKNAQSSSFTNLVENTHWQIEWSPNSAGFGTTEAGSSGSAIYDQSGLIVGTLTGGSSDCAEPESPDFFGRFDYHWDQNGTTSNRRLKDWLDPLNSGTLALSGIRQGEVQNPISSHDWSLVPNPFTNEDELKLIGIRDLGTSVQVIISDLSGRLLLNESYAPLLGGEISLNYQFQKSGFYIIEVTQNEQIRRFKILKK